MAADSTGSELVVSRQEASDRCGSSRAIYLEDMLSKLNRLDRETAAALLADGEIRLGAADQIVEAGHPG